MRFGYIVYNLAGLQKDLVTNGIRSQQDMGVALNAAAAVLVRGMKADTPNSRKSGRSWKKQAKLNRIKWGVLDQSLGRYQTRIGRLKKDEAAGVNFGYLKSKKLKHFIARFMNNGAYNVMSKKFERYYSGYIQRSEQKYLPEAKARYEEVAGARMSRRISNFNARWNRKLSKY